MLSVFVPKFISLQHTFMRQNLMQSLKSEVIIYVSLILEISELNNYLFAYLQNLSKTGIKLLCEHFLHKHTMGKPTILVEYKKLECSSS